MKNSGTFNITAHGERETRRGLHQITLDVLVMAEAHLQHPFELPDRDARFRDVDRNLVGPRIREIAVLGI